MGRRDNTRQKVEAGLPRRRRKELVFKFTGMLATAVGVAFLGVFFSSLIAQSSTAFKQTFLKLEIELAEDVIAPGGELDLTYADFDGLVRAALRAELPEASGRSDRRELYRIVSIGAGYQVRDLVAGSPELIGTTQTMWVPASSNRSVAAASRHHRRA